MTVSAATSLSVRPSANIRSGRPRGRPARMYAEKHYIMYEAKAQHNLWPAPPASQSNQRTRGRLGACQTTACQFKWLTQPSSRSQDGASKKEAAKYARLNVCGVSFKSVIAKPPAGRVTLSLSLVCITASINISASCTAFSSCKINDET